MKAEQTLSDADRRYLTDVSLLAFGNPYGETGQAVRQSLSEGGKYKGDELDDYIHSRVHSRLGRLKEGRTHFISSYGDQDRSLIHHAMLFDCLYPAHKDLDALVEEQIRRGGRLCRVEFAAALIERLTQSGITRSVALHYLAIYYQMRRARYFLTTTLIGSSASMEKLRHDLWNSIFTHDFSLYERFLWDRVRELSTLFVGATGTGKKTAAAAVGYCSYIPFVEKTEAFAESFMGCFMPVRVGQFSGLRLESELFGHQKNAYGEALENHQGVFSRCSASGTVFLDNICEVPLPVQARLRGVIQDRTFKALGEQVEHPFPGRIMAAAPGKVATIRSEGMLRDDLYHSLCVNTITVPSLKQRFQEHPADLELLISHILGKYVDQSAPHMVGRIIERMHEHVGTGYDWPGNLLELEQIVKRILMVSHYESKD